MSHSERRIIMIRKRTHFISPEAAGEAPSSGKYKVWQFANDLGLLAEMFSWGTVGTSPLALEILNKRFDESSKHAFESGEFDDFYHACWCTHRTEAVVYGTATRASGMSEPMTRHYALIFRLFKKKDRKPFLTFHGRFEQNGEFKSFTLEKAS